MIQAITETNLTVYLQTEDNRIDITVSSGKIRHLWKFTNKMKNQVFYNYAAAQTIFNRYTVFGFNYHSTRNVFEGRINFLPSGYFDYEVYEVVWAGTVTVSDGNAPKTENEILFPPAEDKGIVKGLVTKGIMYVADKDGTEQVQYTQHTEASATNYIYYGQ